MKRRPERILFRVDKGSLVPFDEASKERLRERGYRVGDVLAAELRKPRNPGFHRLMHAFGKLVAENIEGFEGLTAHTVLKRLQIEANVGCKEIVLNFPGVGPVVSRQAESLSFESMYDGEATEVFDGMAKYVVKRYWPTLSVEQIREMAELLPAYS